MKKCSKCGIQKPLDDFCKDKTQSDGRHRWCKTCHSRASQSWNQNNPERHKENSQEWDRVHPDRLAARVTKWKKAHPDKVAGYARISRENHPVELRERYKQWMDKNREHLRQYLAVWKKQHLDLVTQYRHTRRAKSAQNGEHFTAKEWRNLCERYENRCLRCGEQKPLTPDHVIPLSLGGTNNISNIQPLCHKCNSIKFTKTTDYRNPT